MIRTHVYTLCDTKNNIIRSSSLQFNNIQIKFINADDCVSFAGKNCVGKIKNEILRFWIFYYLTFN